MYSLLIEKIISMIFKIELSGRVTKTKSLRFWCDLTNMIFHTIKDEQDENKGLKAI